MLLSPDEAKSFLKLHRALMHFVKQQLGVVPGIGSREEFLALPPEARVEIRNASLGRLDLIDSFADENPAKLNEADWWTPP